jgi:LysR family hydrogen peroxide-inducible transcriptional activator
MEINQIRYFLAVCEHRNFTHAGQASNVSQPSLTAAIKKLEEELGGALFLRDRAGCRLTPLGALVWPRLAKIHAETREAKAEAIRHTRLERVPISVGIGETIGQNKISEGVERYRARFPQADIELIVGDQEVLLTGIREGRFDIAITSAEVSLDLFRVDPLYSEGYRVVVSVDHPLGKLETITLEHLANTDMLDRLNCEMRHALHNACADNGHTLYAAYRSNRVEWLLELARRASGAVVLPETAIPDDANLISRPIEGVEIQRQVAALRYRHQPSRPEANELVREFASG